MNTTINDTTSTPVPVTEMLFEEPYNAVQPEIKALSAYPFDERRPGQRLAFLTSVRARAGSSTPLVRAA
jgi:hypothetical protein